MEIFAEQADSHTLLYTYKMLLESSQTVIVVTASVKEDEKGGQGHTPQVYCNSLPHDTAL
jgi:hypothetical protein